MEPCRQAGSWVEVTHPESGSQSHHFHIVRLFHLLLWCFESLPRGGRSSLNDLNDEVTTRKSMIF